MGNYILPFWFVWPFTGVLQEIRPDITRKVRKSSQKATKGTKILAETVCISLQKVTKGNGNPCGTLGFLNRRKRSLLQPANHANDAIQRKGVSRNFGGCENAAPWLFPFAFIRGIRGPSCFIGS